MIAIVPYRAEHAEAFYLLNRAWLDAHALFEPHDEEQLRDPHGTIVAPGGAIFVALDGQDVVGTAAIAPTPDATDDMELIKLTVTEAARGAGLGRRLALSCIDFARRASARRVVLVSSSKLGAALRLYESMGFVHRPVPPSVPYATADVYMERELDPP